MKEKIPLLWREYIHHLGKSNRDDYANFLLEKFDTHNKQKKYIRQLIANLDIGDEDFRRAYYRVFYGHRATVAAPEVLGDSSVFPRSLSPSIFGQSHPLTDNELNDYYENVDGWMGVFMHNNLPKIIPKHCAMIINLADDSDPRHGTHWVCVVRNTDVDDNKDKCLYYDSFGLPPSDRIMKMIKKSCRHAFYNTCQQQQIYSINCGIFCIYVINNILLQEKSFYDTLYSLDCYPSQENENIMDLAFEPSV